MMYELYAEFEQCTSHFINLFLPVISTNLLIWLIKLCLFNNIITGTVLPTKDIVVNSLYRNADRHFKDILSFYAYSMI